MRNNEPFLFKMIPYFIGFGVVLVISAWVFYGYIAYKAVSLAESQDYNKGIKPVIEKVWCGEAGCLSK